MRMSAGSIPKLYPRLANGMSRCSIKAKCGVKPEELNIDIVGWRKPQVPHMGIDCVVRIGLRYTTQDFRHVWCCIRGNARSDENIRAFPKWPHHRTSTCITSISSHKEEG